MATKFNPSKFKKGKQTSKEPRLPENQWDQKARKKRLLRALKGDVV